ncbi:MAG: magnesium transporter CorA family protein, partial [Methanoregulaceae archaeon]|nr:magnesium transporter CorA family protein [Methanoregulaceae archaeon]
MMKIYRTNKDTEPAVTEQVTTAEDGCWIRLSYPAEAELVQIAENYSLPLEFLKAALDEEERPRIDAEDGVVLVVLDVPMVTEFEGIKTLTTL